MPARDRLQRSAHPSAAVSATALTAASEPPAPVRARMTDTGMGEAGSQEALDQIARAAAELKLAAVVPILRQATAALQTENVKLATDLALKALNYDERCGLAWRVLGIAREKVGDFKSALKAHESALNLSPEDPEIANDLGRLAYRLGMKPLAGQLFTHYHQARPHCVQGVNNLACVLRDLHQYAAAIDVLKPAILANPECALLWNTLGTVQAEQGDMPSALTFFDEAIRVDPRLVQAVYNRANAKLDLGDFQGALVDCDAAIAGVTDASDLAMMNLARSGILLCNGRIAEGWDAYEARFAPHFVDLTHFAIERPRWELDDDLRGKSLLLIAEQGLGDEVMFANLLPDVLDALGPDGRLTLAVERRLVSLFQRSFPQVEVGAHVTHKIDGHTVRQVPFVDQSGIDLWSPLASLLRRFRLSLDAFPSRPSYLSADPERVAHWRDLLAGLPGQKVGVLWKSLKLDGARLRYFSPFEQWRPVLTQPGFSFVNLQYGECDAELDQAREVLGVDIWRPPGVDLKNDLDDVAALCCALDLVLGPANATTNIAAACGAPVWLISTPSAWPRLGAREGYAWYPQARVFSPPGFSQWAPVMADVGHALAKIA